VAVALVTFLIRKKSWNSQAGAPTSGQGHIYVGVQTAEPSFDAPTGSTFATTPDGKKWGEVVDRLVMALRISPDGTTIAYSYKDAIWVQPVGGAPQLIVDGPGLPVWSPDSKQLVVSVRPLIEKGVASPKTFRFNPDGSGRVQLPIPETDTIEDWSSDGAWLLAVSDRKRPGGGGPHLWALRPDGSSARYLTEGGGQNFHPRFSPDGRKIVYFHQEGRVSSLWTMDRDGKNRRKIVEEVKQEMQPCWSPDGANLGVCLCPQTRGATPSIQVMAADGSNRRSLSLPSLYWVSAPDWR
jgi:Tol biopolymer transport system component